MNGAQSGAGQGREPRPGLGFLPWPVTQKYLSKPPMVTVHPREPQAPEGLRVGGIIMATFSFAFALKYRLCQNLHVVTWIQPQSRISPFLKVRRKKRLDK